MGALFAEGRIAELILGLMVAEFLALLALRRATGRGPRPVAILVSLLAGACLVLALRAALAGSDWPWVAAWLLAALLSHGADLFLRWRA